MCKNLLLFALLGAAGVWAYRHYHVKVSINKQESVEAQIRKEREIYRM